MLLIYLKQYSRRKIEQKKFTEIKYLALNNNIKIKCFFPTKYAMKRWKVLLTGSICCIYIPLGSWDAAKTNGVDMKLFAFSSSLTMEKHVILLLLIFWSLHLNSLNISSLNLVKKFTNAKRQFISLFC